MDTDQIAQEVFARLDAVAAKLGVAAEHLWPVLVRQQVLSGLAELLVGGSAVVLLGVALCMFVRRLVAIERDGGDGFVYGAASCVTTGVLIPVVVIVICGIGSNFTQILNPEYHALQELMRMVK